MGEMMKNRKVNWVRAGAFWIAIAVTPLATAAVNVELELDNKDNPQALVVTKNSAQCQDEPLDCIEVKRGTKPNMSFELKNACNGVSYKLTKFRIRGASEQWPTSQNPMNADVAKDFCADRNTGYVDFRYCNNDLKDGKMKLKNFNNKVADVYYEVTAASCSNSSKEIKLDPLIRNKG
jgi:hypothetical protein